MSIPIEEIITEVQLLSAEDKSAIENILNYYLSFNNELKNIADHNGKDNFQRMVAAGVLTKKLLGPFCRAIVSETSAGLYATDPDDYGVGWELRLNGTYGQRQMKIISKLILPTSNVLVVGAHIGTLAIPLSGKCNYVAAVEASPKNFSLLEMNLKLNNVTNCEIFNIAANDKEETLGFLLSRANSGGSKRRPLNGQYIYTYDEPEEIQVQGVPLDSYFSRRDFDLVLMDIEGSEYFALKGMQNILHHTKTLIFEFTPHHFRNISGVTMEKLLELLPGFTSLGIPSLDKKVGPAEFLPLLTYMFENDLEDDGIIFER